LFWLPKLPASPWKFPKIFQIMSNFLIQIQTYLNFMKIAWNFFNFQLFVGLSILLNILPHTTRNSIQGQIFPLFFLTHCNFKNKHPLGIPSSRVQMKRKENKITFHSVLLACIESGWESRLKIILGGFQGFFNSFYLRNFNKKKLEIYRKKSWRKIQS
jgi:hypothetical protein